MSIAVSLFALSSCFAAARAATLDGTWHIAGSVQDNPVVSVCVLAEKDGKISGTCTGTDGKPVPVAGTVKDTTIKWQYDSAYQGTPITLTYTAKIDKDDHMSGGIYVDPYAVDGSFTATKDKTETPKAAPAAPVASPATPTPPAS